MEKKEILSVSLASLLKISPLQEDDLIFDGCIMGHRDTLDTESAINLLRFPTRINSFGVVFCSKGWLTVAADLNHFTLGAQTVFVCTPGTIIQVESRKEVAVHFILCEEEFINRVRIDLKQLLHLFMSIRENPCLSLNDAEWKEMMCSVEAVFSEGRLKRTDGLSVEIMNTLFQTLAYRICRVIADRIDKQPQDHDNVSGNRNVSYFNTFLEELSKHYMQERSVGFYAERLHLTPKYLTTLLRTTTGRTASEWIDEYVVLEAKNLLKYSTMNIQEIAYYLNFPNQSFFGRYFKQHTGMSPTSYRASK